MANRRSAALRDGHELNKKLARPKTPIIGGLRGGWIKSCPLGVIH